MIAVSQDFKDAIKSKDRQIKGYVEALYDLPNVEVTPSIFEEGGICQLTSTYTDVSELVNNKRVTYNYGTLDYLPLDGSYLTMKDGINDNAGYITDNLATNTSAYYSKIILSFAETTINGITMYFKNNTPYQGVITFSDGTTKTINATADIYTLQIILDEPKTITGMTIQFNGWEWWQYQNRKIRIDEIDLGITQVFKDKELVEFTIDEEVNKLVEETPINETTITINNMNGMFDPLNPKGIVPYLTENTKIIPYIGVLTESLGIEYVKMGEFYFESYTNNKDKTTTLIGKNLMKQLETRDAISGLAPTTYFIDLNDAQSPNTTYDILTTCGYNVNLDLETKYAYYTWLLNDFNFLNFVRDVTMHNFAVFYVDRNEVLNIKNPVQSNVDTISKNELLEDITFKNIDKINKIKLVWEGWDKTYETSEPVHQTDTYLDETITLKKTSEVFIFKKPVRSMLKNNQNITFTYEGATSINVLVDSSFIVAIEVNGTIGSEVHLVATQTYYDFKTEYNIAQKSMTKNSNVRDKDVMIEITSQLNSFDGNFASATGQLDYAPSYEMEFDYNGDPSLEAGDYISVETPYGYKNLFIQKNHFRYDGGLEGHIEGVE